MDFLSKIFEIKIIVILSIFLVKISSISFFILSVTSLIIISFSFSKKEFAEIEKRMSSLFWNFYVREAASEARRLTPMIQGTGGRSPPTGRFPLIVIAGDTFLLPSKLNLIMICGPKCYYDLCWYCELAPWRRPFKTDQPVRARQCGAMQFATWRRV